MPQPSRVLACLALAVFTSPACFLSSAAQTCAPVDVFGPPVLSPIGVNQRHAEAADVNADGIVDLVISGPGSLVIALGEVQAGGAIVHHVFDTYPGYTDPTGTAIADFDGDGVNDIALAADGGGLYLLHGLSTGGVANGHFVQYHSFDIGSVWDVAAGDLNGDGVTDLAVALRAGFIVPYIGQGAGGAGNGEFIANTAVPCPGSPKGIVLADLNLDGALDVVAALENINVAVLRGLTTGGIPNGAFAPAVAVSMSGTTFDVAVADFNGDGLPDIASANYTGSSVSVALAQPGFTYSASYTHTVPGYPLGIVAGDFNHDGHSDLAVAAHGSGAAFSYLQNTVDYSSTPDGFVSYITVGGTRVTYGLTAADVDGDGGLDVIAPGLSSNDVLVAYNRCAVDRPVLITSVVGNGTLTRSPDQPDYARGTEVLLTATPGAGSTFIGWSGDLSGNANPTTITMNLSRTVVATFRPIQHTLSITLAGVGHGHVTRTPDQATYDEGSTVHLAALPDFGSLFAGWSGDATGADTVVDVVMSVDRAVTATFEPDTTIVPHIVAVADVPLDQGGKLKLRWLASSLETPGSDPQNLITQYFIWREIPEGAFMQAQRAIAEGTTPLVRHTTSATRDFFWEFVTSLPGSRFPGYSYTAATTNDSTELGNPLTSFMVQARNAAGTRWWDSPPDSGYSVDNLSPPTPGPLVASYGAGGNAFHWGPSHAPDLAGYHFYRGSTPDFVPGATNLIGAPTDTTFFDPAPIAYYYKMAAVDVHGNLSHFVLVTPEHPVATLASLVSAEATADRIRLSWYVSQPGLAATLYRRTLSTDWRSILTLYSDGRSFMAYEDLDITRGETYGYRLGIQEGGEEAFFAETYVLAEDARFAIGALSPNPALRGRMTVRFTLPDAAPATLELLDVTGRRIDQRTVQGQVGEQSVEFGADARLSPGIYWLRLRHGQDERSLRAAVLK